MKRILISLTVCLLTIISIAIYANNSNKKPQQTADYIVLRAKETDELEKLVIDYLNRGYSLAGGVFFESTYHQAVYKK